MKSGLEVTYIMVLECLRLEVRSQSVAGAIPSVRCCHCLPLPRPSVHEHLHGCQFLWLLLFDILFLKAIGSGRRQQEHVVSKISIPLLGAAHAVCLTTSSPPCPVNLNLDLCHQHTWCCAEEVRELEAAQDSGQDIGRQIGPIGGGDSMGVALILVGGGDRWNRGSDVGGGG